MINFFVDVFDYTTVFFFWEFRGLKQNQRQWQEQGKRNKLKTGEKRKINKNSSCKG